MQLIHPQQSCQKADWSLHKPECSALQKWAKAAPSATLGVPNDAVRCLGRILWQMKSSGLDSGWVSRLVSMFSVHPAHSGPCSVKRNTGNAIPWVSYAIIIIIIFFPSLTEVIS